MYLSVSLWSNLIVSVYFAGPRYDNRFSVNELVSFGPVQQCQQTHTHTHTHMGSTHNPVLIGDQSCFKQRRRATFVFEVYFGPTGIYNLWDRREGGGLWNFDDWRKCTTKTVYNRRIFRMMREAWFSWDELANASRARSSNFTAIRCFICILIGVEWNVLPPKRYGEAILGFYQDRLRRSGQN